MEILSTASTSQGAGADRVKSNNRAQSVSERNDREELLPLLQLVQEPRL